MSPHPAFSVAVLSAVLMTGCTLTRLDVEVKAFEASTVLVGRVEPGEAPAAPVIVAAWAGEGDDRRLVHQTRLHEPGGYELIVPHGRYRIVAFADLDGDGSHDDGEPAALAEATARPGEALVAGLDLVLGTPSAQLPRDAPVGPHSTQAGAIGDLDAAAFSAASGVNGYWQPLDFFRTLGGNVYFLAPYDAAKTPVLFVHGAAGSPQDWRYQIDHLDHSRYQPWIFFYPSGAPAESMASLLGWKLMNPAQASSHWASRPSRDCRRSRSAPTRYLRCSSSCDPRAVSADSCRSPTSAPPAAWACREPYRRSVASRCAVPGSSACSSRATVTDR